jgi:acyl-CoA thioesterase
MLWNTVMCADIVRIIRSFRLRLKRIAPETIKSENELKEGILNFVPENVRASFMRERHVEIRPGKV